MRMLKPSAGNYRAWTKLIPLDGDLVFCTSRAIADGLRAEGFLVFTPAQFKEQAADLWGLDRRAWHGYAVSEAKAVGFLPFGAIEAMEASARARLVKEQVAVGNTAVLTSGSAPLWLTAAYWASASSLRHYSLIRKWYRENEAPSAYPAPDAREALSAEAREALRAAGLLSLIGTYADRSGPNCFALAAAFAAAKGDGRSAWLLERWLHPAPFFSRLETAGYRKRSYDGAIGIWVVERGNEA
ncbi:MAG: hypothetical protein EOP11_26480, partial [Proteobacteria bacterium]